MIEVAKNYKITLDEEQARLLYHILDVTDNDRRQGLNGLYNELKEFYPESQGFSLSLTKWETTGNEIKINGTAGTSN